ncbi:MAG: MarR family winged helix-turn-helix transcriptional regulator [Acidimicrobiales bacterium]
MPSHTESDALAARATEDNPFDDVAWVAHHFTRLELGDPAGIELMASVARTSRLMTSRMEETLTEFSLGLSQYLVLMTLLLSDKGERRLSHISRHMMVHPTTVTVVVDQLESRGLIKRAGDPADRRVTLAKLTRSGRALATAATSALSSVNFGFPKLGKRQTTQLVDQLAELRSKAGDA